MVVNYHQNGGKLSLKLGGSVKSFQLCQYWGSIRAQFAAARVLQKANISDLCGMLLLPEHHLMWDSH